MSLGVPGDGFSEEFRRQFIENSGLDRLVEKHRKQLSQALQPVIDRHQEHILEQLQPLVLQAIRQAAEALKPLHSIEEDMAKQIAASIDYSTIYKDTARRSGVKVFDEVKIEPVVDDVTADQLDALVEETFANHPDLQEALESDPELVKLSDDQKKMFKWGAVLTFVFGLVITAAFINESEEVKEVFDTITTTVDISDMVLMARDLPKKKNEGNDQLEDEDKD